MIDKNGKELFIGDPVSVARWHGIPACTGVVVTNGVNHWDGIDVVGVDLGKVVVEDNDDFDPDDEFGEPETWDITGYLDGALSEPTGYFYPESLIELIEPLVIEGDDDDDCI